MKRFLPALFLISCAPRAPSTTTSTAAPLDPQAPIMLTHDHVITAAHLEDAIAGGIDTMTLEMTVDQREWVNGEPRAAPPTGYYPRFLDARAQLQTIVDDSSDSVRIVRSIEEVDAARGDGALGIVVGTEGSLPLEDSLARVDDLYALGWRKTQLRWAYASSFADTANITPLGVDLVRALNRRGVVIDTMHLNGGEIDQLAALTNTPLLSSHDFPVYLTGASDAYRKQEIAESGGGYGVVALNILGREYGVANPTLDDFVDGLQQTIAVVGIDHVAIGPDYMPDTTTDWKYFFEPDDFPNLIAKLTQRGFSDADIAKLVGGNVHTLYQRVWNPTNNYDGGPAHFRICGNNSTEPACVAARSHYGQGDLRHRALSCQYAQNSGPVGLQLTYANGQWHYWNIWGAMVPCFDNSTLVVSFGDEPGNGNWAIAGTPSCGAACQAASANAGGGTANARALNCGNVVAPGVVGLQLAYVDSAWRFYNAIGELRSCIDQTTLIAEWGSGGPSNARVELCDDQNLSPACAQAASNGGSGTSEAKALNCYNSEPFADQHGVMALQVGYVDGRWIYYELSGLKPCVNGSVLIATTLPD